MKNTAKSTIPFNWIPFYEELATKLCSYRTRQGELIDLLEQLRAQGLTITPLDDKDESGRRFLLTEIDPFTFFGSFNRGIVKDTRVRILETVRPRFGIAAPVPSDFSGIPILNNQKSWFFANQTKRKPGDMERLWAVFVAALGEDALNAPAFAEAFNQALEVRNTNFNLTIGLFWIRPNQFLSLDRRMRDYLKISLPKDGLSFDFYRSMLVRVRKDFKDDFPHVSHAAYEANAGFQPSFPPEGEINEEVNYWMVGAYWDEEDPADQTERFLAEGIWENGYQDRYLDLVKSMKVGDRIAIKAATTQKSDLPFNGGGRTVSRLMIKATGIVVSNPGDGRTVEVEWVPESGEARNWYFYTARPTVWRLRKEEELAQKLIRFAFYNEPQDYSFFIRRWWEEPGTNAPAADEIGEIAESSQPYAIADMLAEGVFLPEHEISRALRRLKVKKNLVLQGAPGVGKTFIAKRLAYALMEARDDNRVVVVQFHPSYSYEDFVRGYRPAGEAGKFALVDGPLLPLCRAAADDPDRSYVLVIDEINRGNLSQVFGELFMLLEGDKRGKRYAVTPLYRHVDNETLHIPENLYVIGTMNIADRSLALVDYALRRRFLFFTLGPRFGDPIFRNWLKERGMTDTLCQHIITRMSALNTRISADAQLGPAFCIGHSFFCPSGKDFSGLDKVWYRDIVEMEIAPLLDEYWYDALDKAKSAKEELLG